MLLHLSLKQRIRKHLLSSIFSIIHKLPLKRIVVFECESDLDDNPRAIYEWMKTHRKHYRVKLVWIVKNLSESKSLYKCQGVSFVSRAASRFSEQVKLEYYLSTAKWFVFSHPYWYQKRHPEQLIFHVNHGTPIKKRSSSDQKGLSEKFDYLLAASEETVPNNLSFWGASDRQIIVSGFPRNDYLLLGKPDVILPMIFPWQPGDKCIICMPTYKQSERQMDAENIDPYSLDVIHSRAELMNLNSIAKRHSIHIIVKPHPLQRVDLLEVCNLSNVHYIDNKFLFENKIMLYELIGCCDGLISDVSSVITDFLLLNRPIAFLMNNIENYKRGFYIPPEEFAVGEKIYTSHDLEHFVKEIANGKDSWKIQRIGFSSICNSRGVGHYCSSFVDIMMSHSI